MAEVQVTWPAEDLKRIADAIRKAQIGLGKTLEEAVVWAGVYLAKAAGARTATAPKTRKVIANNDDSPGDGYSMFEEQARGMLHFPKRRYPYYREVWVTGPENVRRWYLTDKGDPKFAKIGAAGVAKRSWLWMVPGIKGAGISNNAMEVNKRGSAFEIEIEMASKLPYILKALKVSDGGAPLLLQALNAAGKRLEHQVDSRLRRARA